MKGIRESWVKKAALTCYLYSTTKCNDNEALSGVTHVHTKARWTSDCRDEPGSRAVSVGHGRGPKADKAAPGKASGPKEDQRGVRSNRRGE